MSGAGGAGCPGGGIAQKQMHTEVKAGRSQGGGDACVHQVGDRAGQAAGAPGTSVHSAGRVQDWTPLHRLLAWASPALSCSFVNIGKLITDGTRLPDLDFHLIIFSFLIQSISYSGASTGCSPGRELAGIIKVGGRREERETERSQQKGLEDSGNPAMSRSCGWGSRRFPPSGHPRFSVPLHVSLQLKHS